MFAGISSVIAQGMPPQMQQQMPDMDVSDDELKKFVGVTLEAQQVQMEAQEDMIDIVEEAGYTVERFNEVLTAMQQGQTEEDLGMSSADMEKFDEIIADLDVIQQAVETNIISIIEKNDMEIERFQEINMAVQMSPELQEKYQQYAMEMMNGSE